MSRNAKRTRIATVYTNRPFHEFQPNRVSGARWLRMSEALANLGYRVDMIANEADGLRPECPRWRTVPYSEARWDDYDVVQVSYHHGFKSLQQAGADRHPFILAQLGNVVGGVDSAGVHFLAKERELLYDLQMEILDRSRIVGVVTAAEKDLLLRQPGPEKEVVVVPTAVDREVPAPASNPYAKYREKIAVFIGNLRGEVQHWKNGTEEIEVVTQPALNALWQERLNSLGEKLSRRGLRLCCVGPGAVDRLDEDAVTHLGAVDLGRIWDYHHFANVGIALAKGETQVSECSKIYYYLRGGLPVVSEAPVPNNDLVRETGLGFIAAFGDDEEMADMIAEAADREWNRADAIRYMLRHHTWEARARSYDSLIQRELNG